MNIELIIPIGTVLIGVIVFWIIFKTAQKQIEELKDRKWKKKKKWR